MGLAEDVVAGLREGGFASIVGVPCSLLSGVIDAAGERFVHAPNEGEALGYSVGAWLGRAPAAVLCQNSGLGNLFNALTSLCHPYAIPALLLVGWRGSPGAPDEPQHDLMGRITEQMLRAAGVDCHVASDATIVELVARCAAKVNSERGVPQAILVPRGVLAQSERASDRSPPLEIKTQGSEPAAGHALGDRGAVIGVIAQACPDDARVIVTTGYLGREFWARASDKSGFAMAGSMGHAISIGVGVAERCCSAPTLVVDGDGAILMRLMGLAFAGARGPRNLCHVVIDNGRHESTGGQPSLSPTVDLCAVAAACGYRIARTMRSLDELHETIAQVAHTPGPILLRVVVATSPQSVPPRIRTDFASMAARFRAAAH